MEIKYEGLRGGKVSGTLSVYILMEKPHRLNIAKFYFSVKNRYA